MMILASRESIFGGGERFLESIAPIIRRQGFTVELRTPKNAILRKMMSNYPFVSKFKPTFNRIVVANDFRSLWMSIILDRFANRIFIVHGNWQISKIRLLICLVFRIPIATVSVELMSRIHREFKSIECVVLLLGPALKEERIEVLPLKLPKECNQYVVGTIARLDPVKNISGFVAVVDALDLGNGRKRGLILTSEPSSATEETIFKSISSNCEIIYGNNPENFFSKIDIFLSTSFSESLGLAHLEALFFGVPVVSTAEGGPSEFLVNSLRCGYVPGVKAVDTIIEVLEMTLRESRTREYWADASNVLKLRNPEEVVRQLKGLLGL